MDDLLPPDQVRHLDTCHLGRRIWWYERLDSTNVRATALVHDPANDGLVLQAREQSAGRGQYGRSWQAPPGSSVLLSVLLFPPPNLRRPALLTTWAAVAVTETILRLSGLPAQIKWPNDVVLAGKKVCGILIEQRNSGDTTRPLATVVGIGLNVTQSLDHFLQAGLTLAGSLNSQTGCSFTMEEVSVALIRQLDEEYDQLLCGNLAPLQARWQERLGLVGAAVQIEGLQQHYQGRLRSVTLAGIELESTSGQIHTLAPETIRQITRIRAETTKTSAW
jgi:BirA family biotin operon repressor/biotin-[acetyl-CoA-carboxylase] ligase